MSHIIGKLSKFNRAADATYEPVFGSVELALCGYGSNLPRVPNLSSIGDATQRIPITPGGDGTFSTYVMGNDVINPPGTYYTYTIRDDNGDILQCTAHIFLDAYNYDMDNESGFDPSLPTPGLPPLIINQLQVNTSLTSIYNFDAGLFQSFKAILQIDANMDVNGAQPGNLYTFIIQQDATGGRVLTWAAKFINPPMINPDPNGITVQTFVCDDSGNLLPISGPTWWTP